MADGSAYVYNTSLGWRTYEQAFADKTAADAAEAQAVVDKAAFDANFNRVYDADAGTYVDENGVTQTVVDDNFRTSRWFNTMVYSGSSNNDIYFDDALAANVVGVVHEDESHFDIFFDTGMLARIEYSGVISPIFHFADGTALAYDYSAEIWGNGYVATEGVAENITVSHGVNNVIHDTRPEDTVTFVDAALSNVTNYDVLDRNNLRLFFDNGTVSTIQFWDINSPTAARSLTTIQPKRGATAVTPRLKLTTAPQR